MIAIDKNPKSDWDKKLRDVILDVYLEYGAPASFYINFIVPGTLCIQNAVPMSLLNKINASLLNEYGTPLLFINNCGNPGLRVEGPHDFIAVYPVGIFNLDGLKGTMRKWEKLASTVHDPKNHGKSLDVVIASLANQLCVRFALRPPAATDAAALHELLVRVLRAMSELDQPVPASLPMPPMPADYVFVPPENAEAELQNAADGEQRVQGQLEVDF